MYLRLATGDLREVRSAVPGKRQAAKAVQRMTAHSVVFFSPGAHLKSIRRSEAVSGAPFRNRDLDSAVAGPISPQRASTYPDLTPLLFRAWCQTQEHCCFGCSSGPHVGGLQPSACIAAAPSQHASFRIPASFPPYHQRLKPYIFSEAEVARAAGRGIKPDAETRPRHFAQK